MSVGRSTPPGDGGPRSVEEARRGVDDARAAELAAHYEPFAERAYCSKRTDAALDALVDAVRADERRECAALLEGTAWRAAGVTPEQMDTITERLASELRSRSRGRPLG